MIHKLKAWPQFFKQVVSGAKTFEVRKNDRDFRVGDFLILKEWEPNQDHYTGLEVRVLVTYVAELSDIPGFQLSGGTWVIMSIRLIL